MSDTELVIFFCMHFILSCFGMYIAWFRSDLFRQFLNWNSRIFSITEQGRAWMSSSFNFWAMRLVITFLFIMSIIGLVGLLIEIF